MTTLTMPLYYYDDNGYKIGPIKKKQLFALAERGEIKPETRITDDKIETKAKHIPRLKFYAPEFHRTEELFDPKNINYDAPLPSNSTLKKTTNTSTHVNPLHNIQAESKNSNNAETLSNPPTKKHKYQLFTWITDFAFIDKRLPIANLWACRIYYSLYCCAAILYGLLVTIFGHSKANSILIDFTIWIYTYLAEGFLPILLTWVFIFLSIIAVRKFLEWKIMLMDWIVAATKSAKQHNKNNKTED